MASTFPRWAKDSEPAFVFELSRHLIKLNHEIVALVPHAPLASQAEVIDGVQIQRFPYFYPLAAQRLCYNGGALPNLRKSWLARGNLPFFLLAQQRALKKLLNQQEFDLIHAHWLLPQGLAAVQQACSRDIPVVLTAHAGDVFGLNRFPFDFLMRMALQRAAACTVNSQATADAVRSIYSGSRIELIPMGVDLGDFSPTKHSATLRTTYQRNKGKLIIAAGRLVNKKGFEYLIKAFPMVLSAEPDTILLLAGFGPLEPELRALAGRLKLNDNIHFLGNLEKSAMATCLASADIVVVPSIIADSGDTEGQGVIVIEGQASGTPIIASAVGGITDLIEDGYNGILVPQKDSAALGKALLDVIRDDQLQRRLSENAIQTVSEYSWPKIAQRFSVLFEKRLA